MIPFLQLFESGYTIELTNPDLPGYFDEVPQEDAKGDWFDFRDSNGAGGSVGVWEGHVTIYQFWSGGSGQGNARKALEELRRRWGQKGITVVDPGEPGTDSRSFWDYAKKVGLVDELKDEEGNLLESVLSE